MADADAMFRNWASDTEVAKYLTWVAHTSVEIRGKEWWHKGICDASYYGLVKSER